MLDTRFGLMMYRTEVPVDPSQFGKLVGCYRLRPNQVVEVTTSDGRLYVQLSGQPRYRVFPTSDWTFFYRCVGAQLTFRPGEEGRADRLILHQNSLDQYARRIA